MTELLAFIGVAVVVIVTPGQDTALTVTRRSWCGWEAKWLDTHWLAPS